jgi:hypothetical protein
MRVRGTLLISLQELGMIAGWKLFPLPCLRVGGGVGYKVWAGSGRFKNRLFLCSTGQRVGMVGKIGCVGQI